MHIQQGASTSNFYEFFSDIIFATMAIFVLLMTIFIALINEQSPVTQAKRQLAELEQQIEDLKQDETEIEAQLSDVRSQVLDMEQRDVEIFIIVDRTGSMEQELYNLKNAVLRLALILPKVTDSLKIGVASYWADTEKNVANIKTYSMQELNAPEKDNGRSYNTLKRFMDAQTHLGGNAPILKATNVALKQFSGADRFDGHQVLMILGDVGPYEEANDAFRISRAGVARANQLTQNVSNWVKSRNNRNLIVLFSGRDELNDRSRSNLDRQKYRTSQELFQTIAKQAGQPDAYTENQNTMLTDFLVAALKRK